MRLWNRPEGTISSILSGSNWQACRVFGINLSILLCSPSAEGASLLTSSQTDPIPVQQSKSPSSHVGSAMAVLATLEQAQVLPSEGSREANRVIQSVIQFQSAFAKGTDRSIQEFAHRAVAGQHGQEAARVLERFRASGWTADMLEALVDEDQRASAEELQQLATGFGQFNLSVDDFKRFMQLVRDGRSALTARGLNFEEVYVHHRKAMPGAAGR